MEKIPNPGFRLNTFLTQINNNENENSNNKIVSEFSSEKTDSLALSLKRSCSITLDQQVSSKKIQSTNYTQNIQIRTSLVTKTNDLSTRNYTNHLP